MGDVRWMAVAALGLVIVAVYLLLGHDPRDAEVAATLAVVASVLSLHDRG